MNKNDLQEISQLLDQKFDEKLKPIHEKLDEHSQLLNEHSKTLKSHGKLLRKLKKDQDTMLDMLDREQMNQRKKIKRIEDYVGLPSIAS